MNSNDSDTGVRGPDLGQLTTEATNPASRELDRLDTLELVSLINREDAGVAAAVERVLPEIAEAIDIIAERMQRGGRLIYVGAGTSGRLGVLDAAEIPPTFNASPGLVIGLIAGGKGALTQAVEGAEDSRRQGARDLEAEAVSEIDVVVGIAASGRTPYVLGAMAYARKSGAFTVGFSCNEHAELLGLCDVNIVPVVGPEVLTGSTRLKAGTATKMVLNMLTTGAMVRLGKTYGNLMVDLQATNEKLVERSVRIVMTIAGCSREAAIRALDTAGGELKTAVLLQSLGISPEQARARLDRSNGQLRAALHAAHDSRDDDG